MPEDQKDIARSRDETRAALNKPVNGQGRELLQKLLVDDYDVQGNGRRRHRHQLQHCHPPRNLTPTARNYPLRIPRGFMTGEMLRYRANFDGTFTLYSVGEDCGDDGGDPNPPSPSKAKLGIGEGRDALWPTAVAE